MNAASSSKRKRDDKNTLDYSELPREKQQYKVKDNHISAQNVSGNNNSSMVYKSAVNDDVDDEVDEVDEEEAIDDEESIDDEVFLSEVDAEQLAKMEEQAGLTAEAVRYHLLLLTVIILLTFRLHLCRAN